MNPRHEKCPSLKTNFHLTGRFHLHYTKIIYKKHPYFPQILLRKIPIFSKRVYLNP
ncbi:hypothetical protein B4113_0845 [Geobacillus sp. B4113_201601]|nr:hypothetical protein B4113_0845 [Geobacillus sp. B4113_201601]